jgi:phosphate acetyltransferase
VEHKHEKYQRLIARCQALEPMQCAVVHPCDEGALRGALDAAKQGILNPILIGPKQKIRALCKMADRGQITGASTSRLNG